MTPRPRRSSALILVALFGSLIGCGDEEGTGGGADTTTSAASTSAQTTGAGGSGGGDCEGGVIVDGVCEGKCAPDKCLEGNTCVDNACVLVCDSHLDCLPDGSQTCSPAVEDDTGVMIQTCQPAGGIAGIGAPCVLGTECASGLECQTAGAGDAEAYCTNRDCQSDDECIDGYFCGVTRDPHGICGSSPPKGDNAFCGTTSDPCISVDANGLATDGTSRFEGSVCMLRRSCFKRAQGAPCTSDLDCSQVEGQKCATYAGESRCSRKCAGDGDCTADNHCDTGAGACVPRFTAWVSSGGGFCEPCFSDEDCGSAGTSWSCVELSGGTRGCLDQSFPDVCTTSLDCPLSPSGEHGTCLDEAMGFSPGDPIYHHCYAVFDPVSYQLSCW